METVKYIVKRILIALLILFGVSIIIYMLARMMPTDYVDNQYLPAVQNGTMTQEDVDRIKEIYGLNVPDAYLSVKVDDKESPAAGKTFTKNTKESVYDRIERGVLSREEWYTGSYDAGDYRIYLDSERTTEGDDTVYKPTTYRIYTVHMRGVTVVDGEENESESTEDNSSITLVEELVPVEQGTYTVNGDGNLTLTRTHVGSEGKFVEAESRTYGVGMEYRVASFWDKTGALFGGYFNWLGNLIKGDFGMSFKYKKPVENVIVENMGISFAIAFIATILQFAIAIPLGIKAATNQYGVIDYTVTVLTMMGISLPTFFLAAIVIRVFSVQLGWFPVNGLVNPGLAPDTTWFVRMGDMLWHMVLPMFVLVILSVGSLMRYTRTNTLEVLNADYIRTARAKGLSERSVVYKHAFRNTMIPLVTMMAGILPSLFGGAMITETVFAIPGIGKLAYDALVVADVPFIMGYNMFIAIMTVLGTLLSDLMYAVVDPRVKIGR